MIDEKLRIQKNGSTQMNEEQLEEFLSSQQYGTIVYNNDNEWPDGRVLNFGYYNGYLYFHAAKNHGEKLKHLVDGTKVCVSFYNPSPMVGKMRKCYHESALVYGILQRLDDKLEMENETVEAIKHLCFQAKTPWKAEGDKALMALKSISLFKIRIEYKVGKITIFNSLPEYSYVEKIIKE